MRTYRPGLPAIFDHEETEDAPKPVQVAPAATTNAPAAVPVGVPMPSILEAIDLARARAGLPPAAKTEILANPAPKPLVENTPAVVPTGTTLDLEALRAKVGALPDLAPALDVLHIEPPPGGVLAPAAFTTEQAYQMRLDAEAKAAATAPDADAQADADLLK